MTHPPVPTWTDEVAAWSTLATAVLTAALLVMAFLAWRAAHATLDASRRASAAAESANEQARLDSIEQTRPYVFAEISPSLSGVGNFDIRVSNVGKSAARQLVLDYNSWPVDPDDVAASVKELFSTPRTLPPGCSIRAMWRLEGKFSDGTTEAGLGKSGSISVSYTSDDPSEPNYRDEFDVMIENSGLWPVGESGPEPGAEMKGDARKFYRLGRALVRRVAEASR